MSDYRGWTGEERRREERRQIIERRRKARKEARDRRADDRRLSQICFMCHAEFTPRIKMGSLICPQCETDSLRGGTRHRPRF